MAGAKRMHQPSPCTRERGLGRPQDITKPILERYQRYLFLYQKEDGQPLTTRSQHTRITPLRDFFKWLARERGPSDDLSLQLEAISHMPDEEKRIIKALLDGMIIKYQTKQMMGNLSS